MLLTGQEYLESIRDGRKVYIGSEEVPDVTIHPAFRNAAQSFAMLYDRKRDADNLAVMSYEEDGERYSTWFLRPRSRDDLRQRAETHRRIARWTLPIWLYVSVTGVVHDQREYAMVIAELVDPDYTADVCEVLGDRELVLELGDRRGILVPRAQPLDHHAQPVLARATLDHRDLPRRDFLGERDA